ncbi:hypothetical protein H9P43_003654 [Blastocladiella emersonii ATCC 22665]|nr:hypothetical protein H9P43_003654 [Blastocladiella emersonii ATCC 22665]
MADYLASIYGTEKDKVNCSFYFKIGACRHGDRCSRKHVKPTFSPTILIRNVYKNPAHDPTSIMTAQELQDHFDQFYEDWYRELALGGALEEMHVCDNVGEHLVGNVYARYRNESDALAMVAKLNNRYYAGWPLYAELCPVTDFREACCRQHEAGECNRGGFCNFMHLKHPDPALRLELHEAQKAMIIEHGGLEGLGSGRSSSRRRSSRDRDRDAGRSSSRRDRSGDRDRSDRGDRDLESSRRDRSDRDRDRDRGERSDRDRESRRRERDGERRSDRDPAPAAAPPAGFGDAPPPDRMDEDPRRSSSRRDR